MFFFFNDTATTEIYTLSLHDALPISLWTSIAQRTASTTLRNSMMLPSPVCLTMRSEEHTSELQSLRHLVCRLLLEKKIKQTGNLIAPALADGNNRPHYSHCVLAHAAA